MLQKQMQFFEHTGDKFGIVQTLGSFALIYGWSGDWKKALHAHQRGLELLSSLSGHECLKAGLRTRPWALIWSGKLREAQKGLLEAIGFRQRADLAEFVPSAQRDLAYVLGLQGSYHRANAKFSEALGFFESNNNTGNTGEKGSLLGFWGHIAIREGRAKKAKALLRESWEIKSRIKDSGGFQEVLNWLGLASEVVASDDEESEEDAESYYNQSLSYQWTGRRYFKCGALTGVVRLRHARCEYSVIPSLLAEAEQLAQQYEYNDHLASLRLTQGHMTWDGHLNDWGTGLDSALDHYLQALIYALRYNRFLLDEVLWGGGICTPLDPIIPHYQERGDEGRRMLQALRDWWQTGVNDVGTPRPDSISPIPEGIPLLEAERLARKREPGDGSPQQTVTEKLDAALAEMS